MLAPVNLQTSRGSGSLFVDFLITTGFFYSMTGIMGSFLLFKYKRNVWVYGLAMIGWTLETVFFSGYAWVVSLNIFFYEPVITPVSALWIRFLLILSIVILKVSSIAYFATKKVRRTFIRGKTAFEEESETIHSLKGEELYRKVLEAYLSTVGGGVQRFETELDKIEKKGLNREQALYRIAEKLGL